MILTVSRVRIATTPIWMCSIRSKMIMNQTTHETISRTMVHRIWQIGVCLPYVCATRCGGNLKFVFGLNMRSICDLSRTIINFCHARSLEQYFFCIRIKICIKNSMTKNEWNGIFKILLFQSSIRESQYYINRKNGKILVQQIISLNSKSK